MNNKGFTLIELLAVLAILAVIASIATININKQLQKSDEQSKKILSGKIENAAKLYVGKYHANDVATRTSGEIEVSLKELVDDGLLYLKDNECDSKINNKIKITLNNGAFDYGAVSASDCYE